MGDEGAQCHRSQGGDATSTNRVQVPHRRDIGEKARSLELCAARDLAQRLGVNAAHLDLRSIADEDGRDLTPDP
jgi:hypothetical protein